MKNRLVILGAGGHGKVVADIAVKNGYQEIVFLDDNAEGYCLGFPIKGCCEKALKYDDGETDFVIAVGNNEIRKEIAEKYKVNWATLIHPSAQIGLDVKLGQGSVVMAGAVINPSAVIGRHCIINTCAVVEHDNVLEDYVHISPNAVLGGTVYVGERTHVGIGATVKNNIKICESCVIGAGAVVIKQIFRGGYTSESRRFSDKGNSRMESICETIGSEVA